MQSSIATAAADCNAPDWWVSHYNVPRKKICLLPAMRPIAKVLCPHVLYFLHYSEIHWSRSSCTSLGTDFNVNIFPSCPRVLGLCRNPTCRKSRRSNCSRRTAGTYRHNVISTEPDLSRVVTCSRYDHMLVALRLSN